MQRADTDDFDITLTRERKLIGFVETVGSGGFLFDRSNSFGGTGEP